MMEIFLWIIGTIVGLVFLYILFRLGYWAIRKMTQVVPEGEAVVIYRLGRFNRISGPGTVWLLPGFERIHRTIEERNRPVEVPVPGVFAFGVPNDLTLNLWYSFNPRAVAKGDKQKMAHFVQLRESERTSQLGVKMRDALIHQVTHLQEQMPLPDKSKLTERIGALMPGSARYNALLKGLKYELEKTLTSLGMILDVDHPIVVTARGLSDEIIQAFQRLRSREIDSDWLTAYATKLRDDFPELSTVILAQILSSIEGVDAGKVQRLLLEHENAAGKASDVEMELEFEVSEDGQSGTHIITKPKLKTRRPVSSSAEPQLTKHDLAVLKTIPRNNAQERLSA